MAEQIGGVLGAALVAHIVGHLSSQVIKPEVLHGVGESEIRLGDGKFGAFEQIAKHLRS